MKIGNINISNLKLGTVQIKKVFIGLDLVWTSFLSIINDFKTRVLGDTGSFEGETCLNDGLEEIGIDLFDDASIVVTPNGTKVSKLYSIKPSNGAADLDVVRATSATRVNSSGLVEVPLSNLFLQSNNFTSASWINGGTITPNIYISPDGNVNASRYQSTGAVSFYQTVTLLTSNLYTISVWVKANSGTDNVFRLFGSNNQFSNNFTATTEWQRFSLTFLNSAGSSSCGITRPLVTANVDIQIYGFQIEIGSTTNPYIPTTTTSRTKFQDIIQDGSIGSNIPRLDYSNGTCPSLLVEPLRTNLLLHSTNFTNGWLQEGTSVTGNTQTGPDGLLTADSIFELGTNDVHRTYRSAIATTAATNYTTSFFVKKNNIRYVRVVITQNTSSTIWAGAQFDLDTQTFTSKVGTGGGTFVNATIRAFTDGWYRISVTGSIPGTAMIPMLVLSNGSAMLNTDTRGCPIYLGNTSNSVYVWGAQLELGINVTSYIPTTSTSVTRNGDVISKTAIPTLIGQTSGTIFTEVYFNTIVDIYRRVICISNGVANNRVIIVINTSGRFEAYITNATGNQFTFASSVASTALLGKNKVAIAYNTNDVVFYVNGVQVASTTTAAIPPNLNNLYLGKIETSTATLQMNGYFNKVYLFKSRLTNTILQNLTTL